MELIKKLGRFYISNSHTVVEREMAVYRSHRPDEIGRVPETVSHLNGKIGPRNGTVRTGTQDSNAVQQPQKWLVCEEWRNKNTYTDSIGTKEAFYKEKTVKEERGGGGRKWIERTKRVLARPTGDIWCF